jgi:hypothetical protein
MTSFKITHDTIVRVGKLMHDVIVIYVHTCWPDAHLLAGFQVRKSVEGFSGLFAILALPVPAEQPIQPNTSICVFADLRTIFTHEIIPYSLRKNIYFSLV